LNPDPNQKIQHDVARKTAHTSRHHALAESGKTLALAQDGLSLLDGRQALEHALGRQDGYDLGALAQLRFQQELPIMLGKDRLDDRQAEAGTLFGALDGDRALAKGRQDDGNLFFRRSTKGASSMAGRLCNTRLAGRIAMTSVPSRSLDFSMN